jgi:inosose dehydratase
VLDGIFTVPGDGAIDFPAVVNALKVADYRGWLFVEAEQDPARAPPLVYARRGFAHSSAAVRETGW